MSQTRHSAAFYGITTYRNGQRYGSNDRSYRQRIKSFITAFPGATEVVIAKELGFTPHTVSTSIQKLRRAGEIYSQATASGEAWHAGERRETPQVRYRSVWELAVG